MLFNICSENFQTSFWPTPNPNVHTQTSNAALNFHSKFIIGNLDDPDEGRERIA